jgi:hypothetical protein
MTIKRVEGVTGAVWGQYQDYNCRVRKQAMRLDFDPGVVQEVLMSEAQITWQANQAAEEAVRQVLAQMPSSRLLSPSPSSALD